MVAPVSSSGVDHVGSGCGVAVVTADPFEQLVEVVAGEPPVEGDRGGVVPVLEGHEPVCAASRFSKSSGVRAFALHGEEVDLHLVEP